MKKMTKLERTVGKVDYRIERIKNVDTKGLELLSEKELKTRILEAYRKGENMALLLDVLEAKMTPTRFWNFLTKKLYV